MGEEWEAVGLFPGKYQEGGTGVSEFALSASLWVCERIHSSERELEGGESPQGQQEPQQGPAGALLRAGGTGAGLGCNSGALGTAQIGERELRNEAVGEPS